MSDNTQHNSQPLLNLQQHINNSINTKGRLIEPATTQQSTSRDCLQHVNDSINITEGKNSWPLSRPRTTRNNLSLPPESQPLVTVVKMKRRLGVQQDSRTHNTLQSLK
eukprot:scaffold14128_cov83-Cyclotella_meneghiniana.AAC.1